MTMPIHLLFLYKFAKVFKVHLIQQFPQNKGADQLIVPQILLGLLQNRRHIYFLQALRNLS